MRAERTDGVAPDRAAKDELHEQFARIGRALANPHRVEILDLLPRANGALRSSRRGRPSRSAWRSAHLQALRRAGLVASRRDGTRVLYRLAGDDVYELLAAVRSVATGAACRRRARGSRVHGRAGRGREPGRAARAAPLGRRGRRSTSGRPRSTRPVTSPAPSRSRSPSSRRTSPSSRPASRSSPTAGTVLRARAAGRRAPPARRATRPPARGRLPRVAARRAARRRGSRPA